MTARQYHQPEKPTPGHTSGKAKLFRLDDSMQDSLEVVAENLNLTQNALANAAFGELLSLPPDEIRAVVANYSVTREKVRDNYEDTIAKLSGKEK